MSQLLQVATRKGGAIPIADGTIAPVFVDQGIPYAAAGQLAVDDAGVIDHHWQGLPFTAIGRLAVDIEGVVTRIAPGGAPFTATGLMAFGVGAVDHYSAGIPYTAENRIKFS